MLYLIGPDGLVNRGFINFWKMVWILSHDVFWKFAYPQKTSLCRFYKHYLKKTTSCAERHCVVHSGATSEQLRYYNQFRYKASSLIWQAYQTLTLARPFTILKYRYIYGNLFELGEIIMLLRSSHGKSDPCWHPMLYLRCIYVLGLPVCWNNVQFYVRMGF